MAWLSNMLLTLATEHLSCLDCHLVIYTGISKCGGTLPVQIVPLSPEFASHVKAVPQQYQYWLTVQCPGTCQARTLLDTEGDLASTASSVLGLEQL